MTITEESIDKYVYEINGKTISLDKDLVDCYSTVVCSVNKEYILYLIKVFGKYKCTDRVLSYKIAVDMAEELSGYER